MFDAKLTSCPVCSARDPRHYLTDHRGIAIDLCRTCGFLFMNPRYSDAYLAAYYARYDPSDESAEWVEALRLSHHAYFAQIERFGKIGAMLDVGCGHGRLLEVARQRGWRVRGLDVSAEVCRRTAAERGLEIVCGDLLTSRFAERFDLIVLHQVLEHLKDPRATMERAREILQPAGLVFIATPNVGSPSNRVKRLSERLGLRRRRVGNYFDTTHHLNYFTPATLRRLLSSGAFTTLAVRNGHKVRPGQTPLHRFLQRHVVERLIPRSTFTVIARAEATEGSA